MTFAEPAPKDREVMGEDDKEAGTSALNELKTFGTFLQSELSKTDEMRDNTATFAEPAPKDREVPIEGNKEAAAVLLEKPKTEDAAAALESGEFGEPFGASATKEGDTSPA